MNFCRYVHTFFTVKEKQAQALLLYTNRWELSQGKDLYIVNQRNSLFWKNRISLSHERMIEKLTIQTWIGRHLVDILWKMNKVSLSAQGRKLTTFIIKKISSFQVKIRIWKTCHYHLESFPILQDFSDKISDTDK